MNLVWTPKSGNAGPVLLCSDAVAQLLIAKGSAINLNAERIPLLIVEDYPAIKVEAKVAQPKASPKKKVQTKKKIKK